MNVEFYLFTEAASDVPKAIAPHHGTTVMRNLELGNIREKIQYTVSGRKDYEKHSIYKARICIFDGLDDSFCITDRRFCRRKYRILP